VSRPIRVARAVAAASSRIAVEHSRVIDTLVLDALDRAVSELQAAADASASRHTLDEYAAGLAGTRAGVEPLASTRP